MLANCLIVGAPKAGTTALANYLATHEDVFLPSCKEPRYLCYQELLKSCREDNLKEDILQDSVRAYEDYVSLYSNDAMIRIDASVQYLFYYDTVIKKLKDLGMNPFIIIVLRDPVDRAISNWKYNFHDRRPLGRAIKDELEGRMAEYNSFWKYLEQGSYYNSVQSYLDSFEAVHLIQYDEFLSNPLKVVNDILLKLNLHPLKDLPTKRINKTLPYYSWNLNIISLKSQKRLLRLLSMYNLEEFLFKKKEASLETKKLINLYYENKVK